MRVFTAGDSARGAVSGVRGVADADSCGIAAGAVSVGGGVVLAAVGGGGVGTVVGGVGGLSGGRAGDAGVWVFAGGCELCRAEDRRGRADRAFARLGARTVGRGGGDGAAGTTRGRVVPDGTAKRARERGIVLDIAADRAVDGGDLRGSGGGAAAGVRLEWHRGRWRGAQQVVFLSDRGGIT